jgi:hypothetical protein
MAVFVDVEPGLIAKIRKDSGNKIHPQRISFKALCENTTRLDKINITSL